MDDKFTGIRNGTIFKDGVPIGEVGTLNKFTLNKPVANTLPPIKPDRSLVRIENNETKIERNDEE